MLVKLQVDYLLNYFTKMFDYFNFKIKFLKINY